MKKFLSILLAVVCALSIFVVPGQAAEPSPVFSAEVKEAAQRDIVSQKFLDGLQAYSRPITRGEFARLALNFVSALYDFGRPGPDFYDMYFTYHTDPNGTLYRLKDYHNWPDGVQVAEVWNYTLRYEYLPFKDVKSDSESDAMIRAARLIGLVKGRKNGCYDPNSSISREEAAVMLGRIIHIYGPETEKPVDVLPYTDAEDIGEWALPYVKILCGSGVMNGKGDGGFHPRDSYTVEQSIATFNRMFPALYQKTTPLCGLEVSFEQEYQNLSVEENTAYYKQLLGKYGIICYTESSPMHPEDRSLLLLKVSEKGGTKGCKAGNIPYPLVPSDFRWDADAERLYFVDDRPEGLLRYYLDATTMELVLLSEA